MYFDHGVVGGLQGTVRSDSGYFDSPFWELLSQVSIKNILEKKQPASTPTRIIRFPVLGESNNTNVWQF